MRKKIIIIGTLIIGIILGIGIYLLYHFNFLPHKMYDSAYFNITDYKSSVDYDNDGIDDATDILEGVRDYIKTKPKYKSKYYAGGYPDDEYGVCTDVVAFGLKNAGYDLQELVNNDIVNNPERYNIEKVDKNIDFRRVKNLKIYFDNNAIKLTLDPKDIANFQGGDIVVYNNHIAIVSNKRNHKGINFIIHHYSPHQRYYEEDALESYGKIIGHYRIS